MTEVKETAGGGEEVEGCFGVAVGGLPVAIPAERGGLFSRGGDAAPLLRPGLVLFEMEEQGEPRGQVEVTQAAGTILDVGFEVEDGVAEFGVAGPGDFAEFLGDLIPFAEDEAREGFVMELLVEDEVSSEETMIEGGEGEFEIVGVEPAGYSFFRGARGWLERRGADGPTWPD